MTAMIEGKCKHAVIVGKQNAECGTLHARQLSRSHWETTSTYVLFQEGIIHEAGNPIVFLLRILRTSFRITTRSIILDTSSFDFVPRYFFTTWSLPCLIQRNLCFISRIHNGSLCIRAIYQSFWLGSNGVRARAAPNHRLGVTEVDSLRLLSRY